MTPEQQELLRHEEFIASVERIRAGDGKQKKRWLEILNSSAVTTLITVVLGGIVGSVIVSNYQDKQKQVAAAQEQYQVFLSKQRDVVDHAAQIIGDGQFDSAGLIGLTLRNFNIRNAKHQFSPELQKQRDDILSFHNSYLRQWGTDSFKTELLLDYYFLGQKDVPGTWSTTVDRLNDLNACAWEQYREAHEHDKFSDPNNPPCSDQQKNLADALGKFSKGLNVARSYSWENFAVATSSK
jgi:hypothetical protein